MVRSHACRSRDVHAMGGGAQIRRYRHTVQRRNGARRGEAAGGGDDPDAGRQGIQWSGRSPFVEVACNHCRQGGERGKMAHDGLQLQMPEPPDQPQMGANHAQWTDAGLHIRPNGAAWFQPWQVQMGSFQHLHTGSRQHGIAVPPQRATGLPERKDPPAVIFDHIMGKGGRAGRHPFVRLLQHHQIRLQRLDHLQAAGRATAQVQTNTFLQVIACKTKARYTHKKKICKARGDFTLFAEQTRLARTIWLLLLCFAGGAVLLGRWHPAFVASVTLVLSIAPLVLSRWAQVVVPPSFIAAIVLFVGGTLFLGEAFDFYERFWWWDIAMHGSSAVGFGLVGFVLIFMMFQGDTYVAPPWAVALFAFSFAMAVGALWEVFEFAMDQLFGLNMQKSGLLDTMGDLIVDAIGALVGAGSGWLYLRFQGLRGPMALIEEFVRKNPRFFTRLRRK